MYFCVCVLLFRLSLSLSRKTETRTHAKYSRLNRMHRQLITFRNDLCVWGKRISVVAFCYLIFVIVSTSCFLSANIFLLLRKDFQYELCETEICVRVFNAWISYLQRIYPLVHKSASRPASFGRLYNLKYVLDQITAEDNILRQSVVYILQQWSITGGWLATLKNMLKNSIWKKFIIIDKNMTLFTKSKWIASFKTL